MSGFTKVDNPLLEAMLTCRLTMRQLKILLLVLRFSAGFQKTYAVLRRKDFAFAGISRTCVAEELQKLCALRVLCWDRARDLVWLNPNPRRWAVDNSVEKPGENQGKFFQITRRNSPKWQQTCCQNRNNLSGHKRKIKKDINKIFLSILEEYFLKIAPVSSEEVFILRELLRCYGARPVRDAIAQMTAAGEHSFPVFLKALEGMAPTRREGRLTNLRSSLRRYDKFFPAS